MWLMPSSTDAPRRGEETIPQKLESSIFCEYSFSEEVILENPNDPLVIRRNDEIVRNGEKTIAVAFHLRSPSPQIR